jgi:hypothetical protein
MLWRVKEVALAFAIGAGLVSLDPAGTAAADTPKMNSSSCLDSDRGELHASLGTGKAPEMFSAVFNVRSKSGTILLTEIVPGYDNEASLGVTAVPLDIRKVMSRAAKAECYITPLVGSAMVDRPPHCIGSFPVDSGIGIRIRSIEVYADEIYVSATATTINYPFLLVQPFDNNVVSLRAVDSKSDSQVVLTGPSPTTFIIGSSRKPDDLNFELSVGGTVANFCLRDDV